MKWKNIKYLSENICDDWRAKKEFGKIIKGRKSINSVVSKWQPISPLLIAKPGCREFYPVLSVDQFKNKAFNSAKKRLLYSITMSIFMTCVFIVVSYFNSNEKGITLIWVGLILSIYFISDYKMVTSNLGRLSERESFIIMIYQYGKNDFVFWLVCMVFFGVIQYILQSVFGGFDAMMYKVGVVYSNINKGEWWRLATGPFFHSGISHWIANTATILIIGPIVCMVSRINCITVFLLGNITGALAALVVANLIGLGDAYVGVSGGIYATMGWLLSYSKINKLDVPSKLFYTLFSFMILSILLTYLMMPKSSNVAHIIGVITGVVAYFVLPIYRNQILKSE